MKEYWQVIPGLPSIYQVSTRGRVRRLHCPYKSTYRGTPVLRWMPEKILGGTKLSLKGYPRVNLNGTYAFVHQLVARTFLPNPLELPQVNHKDGVKTNNHFNNLEWVTNQGNRDHAVKLGLIATRANGRLGKLSPVDLLLIKALLKRGVAQRQIAESFGVCQKTIYNALKG